MFKMEEGEIHILWQIMEGLLHKVHFNLVNKLITVNLENMINLLVFKR